MSRCLTDRGLEHVVLERGRVAERWRSERWDSLRLLSPNWMTRLPGWSYRGPDLHGFMTGGEVVVLPRGLRPRFGGSRRGADRSRAPRRGGRRLRRAYQRWALAGSQRGDRHRVVRPSGRAPDGAASSILPSSSCRRARTATQPRCRAAACSSSAHRRVACSSPTNCLAPVVTSCWRSAATAGCHARTGAWTSSGGWSGSAPSIGPSTTCRTPSRRVRNRRCSWLAGRTIGPWISSRSVGPASS